MGRATFSVGKPLLKSGHGKLNRRQHVTRRLRRRRRRHGRCGAFPQHEVAPAERARRVRVQPRVDAVLVEQVPARRQPPHRLAAPHVLQAHRAQRAAPRLAAALGVGGATLVRERWRNVARRRADEPAGAPGRRAARGGVVRPPRARAVWPPRRGAGGHQPADHAEEQHGGAGDDAGLEDAGRGRDDAEEEQRHAGHHDAVAGPALDVVVRARGGTRRGGERDRAAAAHE
jgi:hypothetical protein